MKSILNLIKLTSTVIINMHVDCHIPTHLRHNATRVLWPQLPEENRNWKQREQGTSEPLLLLSVLRPQLRAISAKCNLQRWNAFMTSFSYTMHIWFTHLARLQPSFMNQLTDRKTASLTYPFNLQLLITTSFELGHFHVLNEVAFPVLCSLELTPRSKS